MVFAAFLIGYFAISAGLFFAMRAKCKKNPVFKAPKRARLFYLLSFTWGLPTVLFGGIVAIILILIGKKPKKFGWEWYLELPDIDFGLELGIFFLVPKEGSESLKCHEHGHGIQNIYLGFFNPVVVTLPSAIRFWYRKWRCRIGKPCKNGYSDIWFEKSADESGKALIRSLNGQASK